MVRAATSRMSVDSKLGDQLGNQRKQNEETSSTMLMMVEEPAMRREGGLQDGTLDRKRAHLDTGLGTTDLHSESEEHTDQDDERERELMQTYLQRDWPQEQPAQLVAQAQRDLWETRQRVEHDRERRLHQLQAVHNQCRDQHGAKDVWTSTEPGGSMEKGATRTYAGRHHGLEVEQVKQGSQGRRDEADATRGNTKCSPRVAGTSLAQRRSQAHKDVGPKGSIAGGHPCEGRQPTQC